MIEARREARRIKGENAAAKATLEAKLATMESHLEALLTTVQAEGVRRSLDEARLHSDRKELASKVVYLEGSLAAMAARGARGMEDYKAKHSQGCMQR